MELALILLMFSTLPLILAFLLHLSVRPWFLLSLRRVIVWSTKIGGLLAFLMLITNFMAGRLLKVIHSVVAPDQTRFIDGNVALLRGVAYYASETKYFLQSCLWNRKKLLTMLIGTFFCLCFGKWALICLLSTGFNCLTLTSVAPLSSMGIHLILLNPLMAFVRCVLSYPSCLMYFLSRCWLKQATILWLRCHVHLNSLRTLEFASSGLQITGNSMTIVPSSSGILNCV